MGSPGRGCPHRSGQCPPASTGPNHSGKRMDRPGVVPYTLCLGGVPRVLRRTTHHTTTTTTLTQVSCSLRSRASRATSMLLAAASMFALVVSSPWVDAPKAKALASETVDYAVTFNGSTQSALVADSGTVYDGINGFTVSAWIRPAAACASGFCMIVNKESSWGLAIQAGVLDFAIMGATQSWQWQSIRAGSSTLPRVPTGRWTHVVMAVDRAGNDLYMFVNGRLAYSLVDNATSVPSTGRDSTEVFTIGGRPSAASFNGAIDEFRLYNTARITETLAQADMGTWGPAGTTNLAAYFDFNEGTGTTVVNKSSAAGAGPNLTLVGSPTWGDIKTVDTTTAPGETIVSFPRTYLTEVGGYTLPSGPTRARVLVVGGGGGGGSDNAGGGGAGGVYDTAFSATPTVAVSAGVYAVTVGQGGFGGRDMLSAPTMSPATDGWSTTAFGVSAGYGGAGGSGHSTVAWNYGNAGGPGTAGGSGGGSANEVYAGAGGAAGTGTAFNGFAGGAGGSSDSVGGGGGGASAAGAASGTGTGGAGKSSSISGTATTYGGGGGAGRYNGQSATAAGGSGGGGAGTLTQGGDGSANTGGGGGGATWSSTVSRGGFGGTGLVIIRWALPQAFATTQYALSTDASTTAIAQITDTTNSPLDITNDFTFEAWIKPNVKNSYPRTLLAKEASYLVALYASNDATYPNNVCFAMHGTSWQWQCTATRIASADWTHLAFVRSGGYLYVYLNGVFSSSTAPSGSNTGGALATNNNPVGFGGRPAAPVDNYSGLMDEVRLWDYARSASDISTFYQRRIAGNILYMPFDDVDMSHTAARNDGVRYVVNRAARVGTGFNAVLGTNATLNTSTIASVDPNLTGSGFQGYLPGVDLTNNGTAVTFAVSSQPTKGAVTINRTTGYFNYVGGANNFGADSFTYSVTGANGTTTGTYNLTLNDYAIASSSSFSQSADITATVGSPTSLGYSNPSTQYTNGEAVRAVLSSTSGTLAATLNGSTLAAGAQNSTSLTLEGTQAQINAALNSATITSSATNPTRVTLTLSMKPVDQTVGGRTWVYNTNGHFYSRYDAGAVNLTQAQATTAANAITLGGRRAYLATIQHSGENATVKTAIGSVTAYLGGNDVAVEGTFRWYGNDSNAVFRTAGAAYRSRYNNWDSGEPNDWGGNEDWVEMNGSSGGWNDCGSGCIGSRQYAAIEVDPVSTRTVTNVDFSRALTATASAARNLGLGATFLSTSLWGTSETVSATITASAGTVTLTQGGTTVTAGSLGSSTFTVEATRDTLNTALNTATVTPPASGSSSVTVSYGVKRQTTGSYHYSSTTDHFYFRNTTAAAQATHATTAGTTAFGGTYGYLATVTSGEEYTTVRAISGAESWSGGSDSVSEGQWTWDSPDAYQIYSDFDQSIGGSYQQWDPAGQPDNSGQGMVMGYGSSNSLWDDQPTTTAKAAVYEWAPIDTSLTLNVTASGALAITTPSAGLTATLGTAYSVSTGASGGLTPYTYSLGGSLPSGLSLNASTGVISGTTTVAGGTYAVTVTATDANGATAATSSFSIRAAAAACSPTSTIVGTQTVLQFSSTGYCDWTVPSGVTSVDAFVVGAGGGGGSDGGVGGGGGSATRLDGVVATPGSTMTLQVGAGGTPGAWGGTAATAGGQSSLLTTGGTTYTVNGGSAGAVGPSTTGGAGGTSTTGFAGGAGGTSATIDGTGGGNGKTGTVNYFTGSGVEYGGGGGGGIYNDGSHTIAARAGASGGGNGCAANGGTNTAGSAGVRGGGGGSGCAGHAGRTVGGAGGTGIVIIRYATDSSDAFPASVGTPAYRYVGDNFQNLDTARSTWIDTSGNGRHSASVVGAPIVTTVTGNGSAATIRTVSGGSNDGFRFATFSPTTTNRYTLFQVTRLSGSNRQRILDGVNRNWLSGYWSGSAGVAYHDNWLTAYSNNGTTMTNWQLMTDQNQMLRQFGANRTTATNLTQTFDTQLAINAGRFSGAGERSDFNAAEIILFDGELSATQIRLVENYLARTYSIRGFDFSNTATGAGGVGSLALSKVGTVSTGQADRLTATWTLPNDTAGLTGFTVEYKTSAASTWTTWATTSSTATSSTITGLAPGTNYDVRVTPVDSDAANRPSSTSTGVAPWISSSITLGTMPTNPRAGTTYTLTATVTSGATGTVNFKMGGTSISGCSASVVSSTTATCSWTTATNGSASITADYSGDSSYLASSTVSASSVNVNYALCAPASGSTGRWRLHTITATGPCEYDALPTGVESVDVLVVGGGGGAGTNVGSGGSGGGGYYRENLPATRSTAIIATVGAGGAGGQPAADISTVSALLDGGNGGNSTIDVAGTVLTGTGGTGGQTYWSDNRCNGNTTRNTTPITGVSGSGSGGTSLTSGAGGLGSASSGAAPTAGGSGFTNSITGSTTSYGDGGGGGGWGIAGGAGGAGGGGAGNQTWSGQTPGNPGTNNLGGGGGGGSASCGAGGNGGSGVVIIRYAAVPTISAQPANTSRTVGQTLSLSVTATATGALASDLSYQWRKGGVNITGATSSSLSVPNLVMADAGSYDVVVKNSGSSGAVSSLTSTAASVTVAQAAQTITFGALTGRTYGDSPFTVSATSSSGLTISFATTTPVVCTVSTTTVSIVNIGTCTITASQAGNTDFLAATDAQQSFTVAGKALTVTGVTAQNKVYDRTTTATLNTGAAALSGNIAGDDVTLNVSSAAGTFSSKNVATGKTVTASGFALGGTHAGRYTITQPTTTADITAKA
ncbi:MAG: hypothetical protein FJW53_04030, partial [Actinobacteria bacterium]|nr:hypothetical protein [Actinomycetota bacterium]